MNSLIVWVRDGTRTHILYGDELGISEGQWVEWARRAQGKSRLWTVIGLGLFANLSQYQHFCYKLEKAGMLEKVQFGHRLTPAGHALAARLVKFGQDGLANQPPRWWERERIPGRILLCEVGE